VNGLIMALCACFGITTLAWAFVRCRRIYYERDLKRLRLELARRRPEARRGAR
jgi:hypothetical protein